MFSDDEKALQQRLHTIRCRISKYAPGEKHVRLLLISKTQPANLIQAAYNVGERQFGESYVKELLQKARTLPPDIQWTFVGHLQSNKCHSLLQLTNLKRIASVDTYELAAKLQQSCERLGRTVEVMVQVNSTSETSKFGKQKGFNQTKRFSSCNIIL